MEHSSRFDERFFREHLSRFGYSSITEFRELGFQQMGKDLYHRYAEQLAKYDLGLELLGYGFDSDSQGFVFEVQNPGKVILQNLQGYSAIGSGTLMAMAAMNRKPKTSRLHETIYRLLDAKFSSETAREVGKATYVMILKSNGEFRSMHQAQINAIRKIWEEEQLAPEPSEAMTIIESDRSYKHIGSTVPVSPAKPDNQDG